jgi:hypothetical protein
MEKYVTIRWFKMERVHDTFEAAQREIALTANHPLYKDAEIVKLTSTKLASSA